MRKLFLLMLLAALLNSCEAATPETLTEKTLIVVANGADRYGKSYVVFAYPDGGRAILYGANANLYPVGRVITCYHVD